MKSSSFWLNIIVIITCRIVNCQEDESDDAVGFLKNTAYPEDSDLVDPHSFDYDRATKKMRVRQVIEVVQSNGICAFDDQCQKELKQSTDAFELQRLYTVRLINLLLTSAKLQQEGDMLTGSITLSGTKQQIEQLRGFGDGKITMQQVDAILSEIVISTTNIFTETFTLIDHLGLIIYQYGKISSAVTATLAVLLLIKFVNWSTSKVVIVCLGCVVLLSYFTIWSQLMKEAELKHVVATMKQQNPPIQCEPEKMSFWDRIVTSFDGNDRCLEYYKMIEFDAFHEVTAIDALVETFDRLALQPTARIGTVMDQFVQNSTKQLPFFMRWIVIILFYLCAAILIPLLVFATCVGRIRFWFGPFAGLSIGGEQINQNQRQTLSTEKREPIIYLSPVILERNADGELRQVSAPGAHITDNKNLAVGAGDSKPQNQEVKSENSDAICGSCCCKDSLNKSHVQEDEDPVNKPTKSEVRSKEKGDGDC